MLSNHLILCCLLLLPLIFPSTKVFSSGLVLCMRQSKYWKFTFSIRWTWCQCPSNEHSGLISFRTDWFDLFALQGNLKSVLQRHNSKTSVLQCLSFFMVQLSHPYIIIGKTMASTIWIFVGKVISLFFNVLARFVRVFLPRSKHLVISWLQSPSPEILEPSKRKPSVTGSTFSLFLCHEVIGLDANRTGCHNLRSLNVILSQLFHSPLSPSSRGSLVLLCFLPSEWYHVHSSSW